MLAALWRVVLTPGNGGRMGGGGAIPGLQGAGEPLFMSVEGDQVGRDLLQWYTGSMPLPGASPTGAPPLYTKLLPPICPPPTLHLLQDVNRI